MDMTIGEYLEKLRISCGYSLRLAAKKTTLSHGYIRDVEVGGRGSNGTELIPKPGTLKNFANGYNASFNELMRLAGYIEAEPEIEFEFVDIDFSKILFIEINIHNKVIYHNQESYHAEVKSLFDFVLFENLIEAHGFLRISGGKYINLSLIKSFNSKTGNIYFNFEYEGKYVSLPQAKVEKFKRTLNYYLSENKVNLELNTTTSKPYIRTIRSIIIH